MDFAKYMSFEQFKKLVEYNNNDKEITEEWRNKYHELIEKNFTSPFIDFLIDYNKNNGLLKISNGEGHATNFQSVWNKLVENKQLEKYEMQIMSNTFYNILSESLYNNNKLPLTEELIKEKYLKFTSTFTAGNFTHRNLCDPIECFECAQRLKIEIKSWQPTYFVLSLENRKIELKEPESCIDKNNIQLPITFETGNLLMADWFRIEEFTELVEYNKDYTQESINTAKGCIASTKHYLEKFNFISVVLSNISPDVFQSGNNFIFGHDKSEYNEEFKHNENKEIFPVFTKEGAICTDLWATTIIEKEQLINLLSSQGVKNAKKAVSEYLAENDVIEIKVEPGKYMLNFNGNYENFNKSLKDEKIPSYIESFFSLKKAELVPKLNKKFN